MTLSIIYRGSLNSCNYDCAYCPFGKQRMTREETEADAAELTRFVDRIAELDSHRLGILFTPWGEALIRRYYQSSIARLSRMARVQRVITGGGYICGGQAAKVVEDRVCKAALAVTATAAACSRSSHYSCSCC